MGTKKKKIKHSQNANAFKYFYYVFCIHGIFNINSLHPFGSLGSFFLV